ncbi:MAG: hypothetical protein IRZ21_06465 [Thermoleophilaceae bacterium]|nr:hypothetical protein [Thermoleophilaceae bacterium]
MTPVSHQTVRLSRGKHASPDEGVCVMELASMLANEPFSDRPRSVCPVIGGFLRTYNDWVDHRRRQDLYRYAAAVVGTKSSKQVERQRIELCLEYSRRFTHAPRLRLRVLSAIGAERAGVYAARAVRRSLDPDGMHAEALELIDRLIAVGAEERERAPQVVPAPDDLPTSATQAASR